MARVSDRTDVPASPARASSSNMGSSDGSLPDLEGTGFRDGGESQRNLLTDTALHTECG